MTGKPSDDGVTHDATVSSEQPTLDQISSSEALALVRRLLSHALGQRSSTDERWRRYGDSLLRSRARGEQVRVLPETLHTELDAFDREFAALRRDAEEKADALVRERNNHAATEDRIRDLETTLSKLEDQERLSHLLSRVSEAAQTMLLSSEAFRTPFVNGQPCDAYVLSIDIRRSTELMLKAREPHLFATFVTELADEFRSIIIGNYGVFDKFTGDGILAFFPDFYSGPDAGYFAIHAASKCHEAFDRRYRSHRSTFVSVLKSVGLGIGVDFGRVHVLRVARDLTVVGTPVVYACRMAGAIAGRTFVNQPAYERLFATFSEFCEFKETEIDIKHEGQTLAYEISLNGKPVNPRSPEWTIERDHGN